MKRVILALLLTAGMIAGYGSAFADRDGVPCHRREAPPAPAEP
jgi:hypothetical protein